MVAHGKEVKNGIGAMVKHATEEEVLPPSRLAPSRVTAAKVLQVKHSAKSKEVDTEYEQTLRGPKQQSTSSESEWQQTILGEVMRHKQGIVKKKGPAAADPRRQWFAVS